MQSVSLNDLSVFYDFSPIVQPWADFGNVIEDWKEASINLLLLFPVR